MCGMTRAEILRAILGNLKQHDFYCNGKYEITEEEGKILKMALEDYRHMCEAKEVYYVPFPDAVFNDNTVARG